jgi:aspartate aminotransferase
MHISQRTLHIPTSPIRKLAPIANRVEKTKKIYHLNIGQPDIPTPESFFKGVASYHPKVVAYGKSQGDAKLLEGIRKYYAEWGMDYAIDDIFVTNGGSEALSFAIMTTCDPGDNVLMFEPFYATTKALPGPTMWKSREFPLPLIRDTICRIRKRWKATSRTGPVPC